jgi:hypothetical protein
LLDFQSDTLDGAGRANLAYTRSIDGNTNTELRFVREIAPPPQPAPPKRRAGP